MIGHSTLSPCSLAVGMLARSPVRRLSAITASMRTLLPALICCAVSAASPVKIWMCPPWQRCRRFTAALEGNITHVLRIYSGRSRDHRSLHPVLAADRAASAEHDLARIGLDRDQHILQRLVRRVLGDDDGAVVGCRRRRPSARRSRCNGRTCPAPGSAASRSKRRRSCWRLSGRCATTAL